MIGEQVRRAGSEILAVKGATYYGVSSALARITQVIVNDQRSVLTVSTHLPHVEGVPDVTISMPQIGGGEGIVQSLPLALNGQEHADLKASAQVIRHAVEQLGL